MNKMKNIKLEMIKLYKTIDYDWLNFKIYDINDITFHHIIKKENGGKYSIDNGALLTTKSHEYLHIIENNDIEIYIEINKILKKINEQKHKPTEIQKQKIELLFLKFECINAKKLIKGKYSKYQRQNIATNKRKRLQA